MPESPAEDAPKPRSANNIKSPATTPSNGSRPDSRVSSDKRSQNNQYHCTSASYFPVSLFPSQKRTKLDRIRWWWNEMIKQYHGVYYFTKPILPFLYQGQERRIKKTTRRGLSSLVDVCMCVCVPVSWDSSKFSTLEQNRKKRNERGRWCFMFTCQFSHWVKSIQAWGDGRTGKNTKVSILSLPLCYLATQPSQPSLSFPYIDSRVSREKLSLHLCTQNEAVWIQSQLKKTYLQILV